MAYYAVIIISKTRRLMRKRFGKFSPLRDCTVCFQFSKILFEPWYHTPFGCITIFTQLHLPQIQIGRIDYTMQTTQFQYPKCAFGGSKPPPYIRHAWQAERPAVRRMQLSGQLPRPTNIQKLADHFDLPVALFYFSAKDITLFPVGASLLQSKDLSLIHCFGQCSGSADRSCRPLGIYSRYRSCLLKTRNRHSAAAGSCDSRS